MAPIHLPELAKANSTLAVPIAAISLEATSPAWHVPFTKRAPPGCSGWKCLNGAQQFGIVLSVVVTVLTISFLYWYLYVKQSNRGQTTAEAWRGTSGIFGSTLVESRITIPLRSSMAEVSREVAWQEGRAEPEVEPSRQFGQSRSRSRSRARRNSQRVAHIRIIYEEPDSPAPSPITRPQQVLLPPPPPHSIPHLPSGGGMPPGLGMPPGAGMHPGAGIHPGVTMYPGVGMYPGMAIPPQIFMPPAPGMAQPTAASFQHGPHPMGFAMPPQQPPMPPNVPLGPQPSQPSFPSSNSHPNVATPSQVPPMANNKDRGQRRASHQGHHQHPPGRRASWIRRVFSVPSPGYCSTVSDSDSPPPEVPSPRRPRPRRRRVRRQRPDNNDASETGWAEERTRRQQDEANEEAERTGALLVARNRAVSLQERSRRSRQRNVQRSASGNACSRSRRNRQSRIYSDYETDNSDAEPRQSLETARRACRRRAPRPTSQIDTSGTEDSGPPDNRSLLQVLPSLGFSPPRHPNRQQLLSDLGSPVPSDITYGWSREPSMGSGTIRSTATTDSEPCETHHPGDCRCGTRRAPRVHRN
ncbi:hypothetical protein QBC33DRAFT_134471 [Phialemonium atrogriseum]|uniref:Uncharacterized protein n=1 Tax=Phialemonium atrogriseum TaxID=1093897 RepID=A0AAJ0BWH4_9PEZI|nr:uncharacterized protein QBC33DRAFT_134471 [Phialemonium atrogriseum]KAK1765759.1 hypothetical protein QBC33DRAFT_134471 [Phialemonium atrogriseum]